MIKGRGITTFEEYAAVERRGRRTPLQEGHRLAVWHLYAEYERLRVEKGRLDFADLLLAALAEVRREPLARPYASVIVDEVQDLTLTAVRLLYALVGDVPDGLLLVGDDQQKVYPGGFLLADAGISVRGRAASCGITTATARPSSNGRSSFWPAPPTTTSTTPSPTVVRSASTSGPARSST